MADNRWQLVSMRDGFADSLMEAKNKLTALLVVRFRKKELRALKFTTTIFTASAAERLAIVLVLLQSCSVFRSLKPLKR